MTEDRGQKSEDRGQKSEDRRQMTDDRGQMTEDRGQKTEDRRQRTEVRFWNTELGIRSIGAIEACAPEGREKKSERGMRPPARREGGKESKV